MANDRIKGAAKAAGIKLWEIADVVGVTDSTFSKQLRREFPKDKQEQVLAVIEQIAAQKAEAVHGEQR